VGETRSAAEQARDVVITRVLDAPRSLVFKVWTEPGHIVRWWGPKGFTSPYARVDLQPGGRYLFCMRSPEGRDFWSTGVFREVAAPERLAFTGAYADEHGSPVHPSYYGFDGEWPDELLIVVTFEDDGEGTRVTVRHSGLPADHIAAAGTGWSESLDKLADAVATADRVMTFARMLDAPRDLVFDAWTRPEHVAQWWGPDGFTTTTEHMDVRPGGHWRFVMHGPDGTDYRNHIVFLEVARPERLVYKHVPEPGTEPVSFEVTVRFTARGDRTHVTMQSLFPSAAALEHVVKHYRADEGARQTLGRLAGHLASLRGA